MRQHRERAGRGGIERLRHPPPAAVGLEGDRRAGEVRLRDRVQLQAQCVGRGGRVRPERGDRRSIEIWAGLCRRDGERNGHRGRDRKSTRLNSSHMSISYAVFCLKKKKKKKT